MKKRIALVLLMGLLCALCLCAAAEEEKPEIFTSGDYEYILLEDGTAEITKYNGNAKRLYVPAELDGHAVTGIGDEAFFWCSSLGDISLPDTLTSIGDGAFYSCKSLTGITLPDSLTTIGKNPFSFCDALLTLRISPDHPAFALIDGVLFEKSSKKLIFYPCGKQEKTYSVPQEIREIGYGAFSSCDKLTDITLPDSLVSIGDWAFSGCSGLTGIILPDSLTSIGDKAFSACSRLTGITLPNSIATIGKNPFMSCYTLLTIKVSPDHPLLAVIDGVLFEKSSKKLIFYPCGKQEEIYSVPQGIREIDDGAFYDCFRLTGVTLPDSLTSIGDRAFCDCSSLTSVTLPDSLASIGSDAFSYCSSSLVITVPRDSYAAQYCKDNNLNYTYPDANDWLNN